MAVRLCHLIIDDSESKIDHKERSDEDHKHKVDEGAWVSSVHSQSHHKGPALKCHTLEYCQERHEEVVKRSLIVIWVHDISMPTEIAGWAIICGTAEDLFSLLLCHTIYSIDASQFKAACKDVQSYECKKQVKEPKNDECVL